jgi:hypothetical protein
MRRGQAALSLIVVLSSGAAVCRAAAADTGPELSAIVVTATRVPESSLDLPVSIDRVDKATIRIGQLQVSR